MQQSAPQRTIMDLLESANRALESDQPQCRQKPMVPLHVGRRPSFHRVRKKETDAMKMTVAQMLQHDHTQAARQDDNMIPRAAALGNSKYGGKQSIKGKGQWMSCDSRAMLSCTFEKNKVEAASQRIQKQPHPGSENNRKSCRFVCALAACCS